MGPVVRIGECYQQILSQMEAISGWTDRLGWILLRKLFFLKAAKDISSSHLQRFVPDVPRPFRDEILWELQLLVRPIFNCHSHSILKKTKL